MSEKMTLERMSTGIKGLDTVLNGGLLRSGCYMVMGSPGSGKSTFGNQVAFHEGGPSGGRAVYVTLLAESHSRMLECLRSFSFVDESLIAQSITYLSGFGALEKAGLKGLLDVTRKAIREHKATLLVVDGVLTANAYADGEIPLRKFLHELQTFLAMSGCTGLLLTGADSPDAGYAERTMADGIITLSARPVGQRAIRELEVRKYRGSSHLEGKHVFEIGADGIVVHPRTESYLGRRSVSGPAARKLISFGEKTIDDFVGGGLDASSSTLILGSPGTGKTLLSLAFLRAGAEVGERGLYFGFSESPDILVRGAVDAGVDLRNHLDQVDFRWEAALEINPDALAERIVSAAHSRGARRLVIDGLDGVRAVLGERYRPYLTALFNELRVLGLATIVTEEAHEFFGPAATVPVSGISGIVNSILFLRYAEMHSRLIRVVSVMKMRWRPHDTALHQLYITPQGISVGPVVESAEGILTGVPHLTGGPESSS